MLLTAPRLWIDHGDIQVIDDQGCSEFKPDVTPTHNHRFSSWFRTDAFYQDIRIINFSQIIYALGIGPFCSKIREPDELHNNMIDQPSCALKSQCENIVALYVT